MQKVIGVRKEFDKQTYYFLTDKELKIGDKVVVVIDDFTAVSEVKSIIEKKDEKFDNLPSIKRIATEQDLNKDNELKIRAKVFMPQIKNLSLRLGLVMKFIGAHYSLDCSKIVIIFSSEDRVDFRQFLKELINMLKIRIELKQIGQRDEVKVVGGVGPCGEPCCCARFLKDFEHVTVKMAKSQGLSLSPTKINGICGRLMCCLAYESSQYDEILEKMPKINSEIKTPNGKGLVVYNDILRERVSVKRQTDSDNYIVEDFALEELNFKSSFGEKFDKQKDNIKSDNSIKNIQKTNKKEEIKSENKSDDNLNENTAENKNNDGFKHKKNRNKKFKKPWMKNK